MFQVAIIFGISGTAGMDESVKMNTPDVEDL